MRVHTEAPAERDVAQRAAAGALIVAIGACVAVDLAHAAWYDAAGTAVAVAAAVAVGHRPERRRMALLILLWVLAGALADVTPGPSGSPVAVTVWLLGRSLQPPLYAHMALAYPAGRVQDRLERAFLAVAYPVSLAWGLIPALFGVRSLIFVGRAFDLGPSADAFSVAFIALGAGFVGLVVRRLWRCPRGARRTLLPLAAAGCFAAADLILLRVAWLSGWSAAVVPLDRLDSANLVVLPLAIFLGIARIRQARGPLGDLVVELAAARPAEVRGALARAIGDPSLELALVPEGGPAPAPGPDRAVTLIGPSAALVHDPALSGQQPLLVAAGAAARMALENARLNAELRAQLGELRHSRARIVAAGDAERRRLERDLHDGAQQRLLAVGIALQLAQDGRDDPLLADAQSELQAALHDLRELARGIHPAILADHGLGAAVASLLDRAPLPVRAAVGPERYPAAVETAAYFVVSEALANVTKHARARSASVTIAREDGRVVVQVSDDGRGGADPATGSGLQGLLDRVGALDGRFTIDTRPGAGTTIRAEIPCASS